MKSFLSLIILCALFAFIGHVLISSLMGQLSFSFEPDTIFFTIFAGLMLVGTIFEIKKNFPRQRVLIGKINIFLINLSRSIAGIFI